MVDKNDLDYGAMILGEASVVGQGQTQYKDVNFRHFFC